MTLKWTPPRLPRQKTATHSNTASYSPIVALGARRTDGTQIPERDFMRLAYTGPFSELSAPQFFTDNFNRTGSLAKAFRATAQAGNREQKRLIKAPVWSFDRNTFRKNGEIAGFTRDIVDEGNLLRSHQAVRFS
ncbi:MAG: hypothetical protein AAF959_15200 [Cyanobacteria bacterium P01_D01_bin.56]